MKTTGPAETISFEVTAGVTLEAELARPASPVAAAVICHPHPLYGGNMYSHVVDRSRDQLLSAVSDGAATLRFNVRGVEGVGMNSRKAYPWQWLTTV